MLSVKNRLTLALVLLPAIVLPTLWLLLAINATTHGQATYGFPVLIALGIATAFAAAYSIASFLDYMLALQRKFSER